MNNGGNLQVLKGKVVIVGVSASISIYRTLDTIRDLRRRGADVIVGMTEEAQGMIDPRLFEWASERPVITEITGKVEHVELFLHRGKEVILLICPATYNMIGKMASGIADDVVSLFFSFAIGNHNPIVVCPVMHESMMSSEVNRKNMSFLESIGVTILPPILEEEKAKISRSDKVTDFILRASGNQILGNSRVLIVGGRGEEAIDPVRVITNRSTGLTGLSLARFAFIYGSPRTVLVGNSDYPVPDYVEYYGAHTMDEYSKTVKKLLESEKFDIVINSASLPDFMVDEPSDLKLDSRKNQKIMLKSQPKLNVLIRKMYKEKFVTFKLEGIENPKNWRGILETHMSDYVVYNSFSGKSRPYGEVMNHYYFIDRNGVHDMGTIPKEEMAMKMFVKVMEDQSER